MNNVFEYPDYKKIVAKLKTELVEMRVKYQDSEEWDKQFIEKYN